MNTLSYIKFLWNSTNSHGVHSPFVFEVVNGCLYNKDLRLKRKEHKQLPKDAGYKKAALLYRILLYFKPQKLLVLGDNAAMLTTLLRDMGEQNNKKLWFFSTLAPIPGHIDMACISGKPESLHALLGKVLEHKGNDTLCLIDNIHSTAEMEKIWEELQSHPQVTVTIDTYYMGLIFFRNGQAKQHFTVRLSRSLLLNALLGLRNLYGLLP